MKEEKKSNPKAQKSWEILDKLMKDKGVTAYKIAKDNKGIITTVLFTDWKNGKSVPKLDKVRVIAEYLGVTTDFIMGFEDDKKEILDNLPDIVLPEDFTEDEKEIISCYRKLNTEQKTKFRSNLLSMMLED